MKTGKKLALFLTCTTLAAALPIHAAALIGDLNGDGVVDAADAKKLAEYFAGYGHEIDPVAADVDIDGDVDRKDGMILSRYADGWDGYTVPFDAETLNAKRNAELSAMAEQNDGELPEIYLEGEDSIPQAILGSYSDTPVTDYDSAIESLKDVQHLMLIENPEENFTGMEVSEHNGTKFYKMQQMYKGIPVYGKQVIVSADAEGNILSLTGDYDPLYDIDVVPVVTEEEIDSIIQNKYGFTEVIDKELMIYTDTGMDKLVWKCEANGFLIFIDAQNQIIVDEYFNVPTAEITGQVEYEGETIAFPVVYKDNRYIIRDEVRNIWVVDIEGRSLLPNVDDWDSALWKKVDSHNNVWNDDDITAIRWYNKLCEAYDYYYEVLNLLSFDGLGSPITCAVNKQVYGTACGGSKKGKYGGIALDEGRDDAIRTDQAAHEYTHAVELSLSNMNYKNESGAIMEANSDFMGELIEEYVSGRKADWQIFSRSLSNPSVNGQPTTCIPEGYYYTGSDDNGGVHHNSTVISHTLYKLYTDPDTGLTNQQMAELLYHTLFYLPKNCSYSQYFSAVFQSAIDLGFESIRPIINQVFDEACINRGSGVNSVNWYDEDSTYAGGYIYDKETGRTVSGCTVKIREGSGNQTGEYLDAVNTANVDYAFTYQNLPVGKYTVEITHPDYKTAYKDIAVSRVYTNANVGEALGQDIELEKADYIASGKCGDNITWTLDNAGTLILSGTGVTYDYGKVSGVNDQPWWSQRDNIKKIIISDGIKGLGWYNFNGCKNLQEVEIADSLENLGKGTFVACSSLEEIVLPNSITFIGWDVFYDCKSLREIRLSSKLNEIGYHAFYGCENLERIDIPDSVSYIGVNCFLNCINLKDVYFYGSTPDMLSGIFDNTHPSLTLHYIEGKSGWSYPTITINGITYNTATWTP